MGTNAYYLMLLLDSPGKCATGRCKVLVSAHKMNYVHDELQVAGRKRWRDGEMVQLKNKN